MTVAGVPGNYTHWFYAAAGQSVQLIAPVTEPFAVLYDVAMDLDGLEGGGA